MAEYAVPYQFLPWTRLGIAATLPRLTDPRDLSGQDVNPTFPVTLTIDVVGGAQPSESVPVDVRAYGPGDIIGIDRRQVIRTDPLPFVRDFEPNYLPLIEFGGPSFPWMFTPGGVTHRSEEGMLPWLVLVVVKQQEGVRISQTGKLVFQPPAILPIYGQEFFVIN